LYIFLLQIIFYFVWGNNFWKFSFNQQYLNKNITYYFLTLHVWIGMHLSKYIFTIKNYYNLQFFLMFIWVVFVVVQVGRGGKLFLTRGPHWKQIVFVYAGQYNISTVSPNDTREREGVCQSVTWYTSKIFEP